MKENDVHINQKHPLGRLFVVFTILLLLLSDVLKAQESFPDFIHSEWSANWITVPETRDSDYGVYLFRKHLELTSIPLSFPINISGDNRYKLFVNGKLVVAGPARGDVMHWNYEIVDLAPFLQTGENIIAAQVWNEGEYRADANMSFKTGFILQGRTDEAQQLNTNSNWKCIKDTSYSPIPIVLRTTSYRVGPGELIDRNKSINGWKKSAFDDSNWKSAKKISKGYPKNLFNNKGYGIYNGWQLVPPSLPNMELTPQRLLKLRLAEGLNLPKSFPSIKTAVTIPPHIETTIVLDQTYLTNAYVSLLFSGGKNTSITLGYAETYYERWPFFKGNRNEVEGKEFKGRVDKIISDGSNLQEFSSLSFRTYRYIQLEVKTKDSPLIIEDIYGIFTGYPFQLNASLETDRTEINKMMEIGWRTARLCAFETYMDCPYYEQLQYIGDTRIQGLISLFNSGDDRLLRNAIDLIDYSRTPEGLILGRYPAKEPMIISPFSVWYIGMLHDYMMYGNDIEFVKSKLNGARQIMQYFQGLQQNDGSFCNLPGWTFTDWVDIPNWNTGSRSLGNDGNSALLDTQFLLAYQWMANLEEELGAKEFASQYHKEIVKLKKTIQNKYWDETRKLYADRSEKDLFSQHTNSLAILTGLVDGDDATLLAKRLLSDKSLAPASVYFKFYLHSALVKAGLGDDYLDWLGIWRENIAKGLTTWAETSNVERSRSDCHAWGSSPNIEFFRTVLGIDSDAPGFIKIKIKPHLGDIQAIAGEMPHPKGKIKVKYNKTDRGLFAEITIPDKTSGVFIWEGKEYYLLEGVNYINII